MNAQEGANPQPDAGPMPGAGQQQDAPEMEATLLETLAPFLWLTFFLMLYAYSQGINRHNFMKRLFPKKDSSSQNFEQQAKPEDINSRQNYLDKLQAKIDATAKERKQVSDKKANEKAKNEALDKINKQQALIDGTHYSGMANSLDDEEQKKREEIEEILKRKREAKARAAASGNSTESSGRRLRDDFNPLGNNGRDDDACRYRPGAGQARQSA